MHRKQKFKIWTTYLNFDFFHDIFYNDPNTIIYRKLHIVTKTFRKKKSLMTPIILTYREYED